MGKDDNGNVRIVKQGTFGSRYKRIEQIAWWQQNQLRDARVLLVGAGALGNEILKNLALLGVGRCLLVDFDTVDVTNLTRSVLFREADIKQPKAIIAAERASAINPDTRVFPVNGNITYDVGLGIYRRVDLVIGGVDNDEARRGINQACWRVGLPWFDAALQDISGEVRYYYIPEDACFECGLTGADYHDLHLRYSCQNLAYRDLPEGSIPTTPTSASITAALLVQLAVKYLHGERKDHSFALRYDGDREELRRRTLSRRGNCPAHTALDETRLLSLDEASAQMSLADFIALLKRVLDTQEVQVITDRDVVYAITDPISGRREDRVIARHRLFFEETVNDDGLPMQVDKTHRFAGDDPRFRNLTLEQLGIPPLHIVGVRTGDGRSHYVELTGDAHTGTSADFVS